MGGADFIEIADDLASLHTKFQNNFVPNLKKVADAATSFAKSWSGSNIGYHANVYYSELMPTPRGAFFSPIYGMRQEYFLDDATRGDWQEYASDSITNAIYRKADVQNLNEIRAASLDLEEKADQAKSSIISGLTVVLRDQDDQFISGLLDKCKKCKIFDTQSLLKIQLPTGQFMTTDQRALSQGIRGAPHQYVIADMAALDQPSNFAKELSDIARQAGSHLTRLERRTRKSQLIGTNVFIGHGRSHAWRILKDFIKDRTGLPYDEFNRVPVAGVTNITRLSEMLDSAAIAFLVLTAEDEQMNGLMQARMTVIHEVGLFQGRLGFSKAIVLLEDGCEEFSNIQGLGQIRFPKNNISSIFEEVRLVLEREGLIEI